MIAMTLDYRKVNPVDLSRVNASFRRNLLISMKVFGNKAVRRLRKIMRSGKFAENSPPWKAAKGGGKVFFHTNHLSTLLESDVRPGVGNIYVTVEVGWPKAQPHPARETSKNVQEIVEFLQEEHTWEPSWSSAKAFWAQVPSEWKKANPPMFKGVFKSPARSFMTVARNDVELQASFLHYVKYASERALKGK